MTSCIPVGCGANSGENPVREGQKSVLILPGPPGGFAIGEYRVDLQVKCWGARPCTDATFSLPMKIMPALPATGTANQISEVEGFNIAAAALGGRIASVSSQRNDDDRSAANLIDGFPVIITDPSDCEYSCGWFSKEVSTGKPESYKALFPQDIVFSFYKEREAVIHAVVVDTTPYQHWHPLEYAPRHVEVWGSTATATDSFSKIADAQLSRRQGPQVIRFAPTRAKYVRVRILSNYGGKSVWIGEVKIVEAPGPQSILADAERNLASPALGGAIVRFTSLRGHHDVGALVDGSPDLPLHKEVPRRGWVSADGALPQDFVFAFRGDQAALIDRVAINPTPDEGIAYGEPLDRKNWPQQISIWVSNENAFDGFEEVGQFTVAQEPREQSFPVKRRARLLRLRILKNFGGERTALNEVKILEGSAPDYRSILQSSEQQLLAAANAAAAVDETDLDVEKESNNTAAEANALQLGRRMRGAIDPLGEQDHFKLSIPGSRRSVLTLAIDGRPYIRSSVSLIDQSGKSVLELDPRHITARRAEFSWLLTPGDYLARVTEPTASIVLIWDTSGSMDEQGVNNLKTAVEAYVSQVQPTERYNLIRFSGHPKQPDPIAVEVLLPEFTSDRQRLLSAVAGKFFSKGGTPFYDAIVKGMDLLAEARGNRAIVVMTDGIDTTSELGGGGDEVRYATFWRRLERNRIRLYTIGLGSDMPVYYPLLGTTGTRFLGHMAGATVARSFFTSDPEELKKIYEQIAAELRGPSTYYLRPSVSSGMGTLAVTASGGRIESVAAPSQIELILDASGSMKRRLQGRMMIDIAKDAMNQIINELPEDAQVALRVYGHRVREGRPGDCRDTQLLFPFAKIDKSKMLTRVRALQALGTTPIDYTLRQVAGDFGRVPGEKLVILVTDGKEECKGNPADAVADLMKRGLQVRLNVVGFALAEAATKKDMERVAQLTGGRFFDAKDASALTRAIQESLSVPYDVLDAAGEKVGGGVTGQDSLDVPDGIYTVVVKAAGGVITVPNVRVRHGQLTKIELRKEGAEVGVKVVAPAAN